MESELTKRIKIALRTYKPILSNMRTLRLKKESAYKDISKENLNIYLFNALKKWCDLKRIQY
ncbi:hypothetical protein JJB75_14435 [Clostridium perfringens]|uniref:hypothetical protein n=1 Tax=Clostridium perfringens TaxID=1502 RepID=UPI001ABAFD9B|nr:hypothetical protein [Clostridium perfringens]MBO3304351.1 hypothetical protein [Clostridium perfringens]MBO3307671.1 hypothetical protein [Clostridium perfringens]MBO3311010.1 hypothetical protein [Clostridium perfringens]MBO3317305.1 hypothetical protein [Clostridium perfringens]